jgi:acyl-homoserine-lactone acylase
VLPFTEQQILSDPNYQVQTINQQDAKAAKVAAQ